MGACTQLVLYINGQLEQPQGRGPRSRVGSRPLPGGLKMKAGKPAENPTVWEPRDFAPDLTSLLGDQRWEGLSGGRGYNGGYSLSTGCRVATKRMDSGSHLVAAGQLGKGTPSSMGMEKTSVLPP